MKVIYLRVTDELYDKITTAADGRSLNKFVTAVLSGERNPTWQTTKSDPATTAVSSVKLTRPRATPGRQSKQSIVISSGLDHRDHPNFRRYCGQPGCPFPE